MAAITFIPALASAQVLNFDFDFTGVGDVSPGGSSFSGTVSGEIIGLQNNATTAASNIIITSAPGEFGLTGPLSFAPYTSNSAQFTVSNSQITAIPPGAPYWVDSTGMYELVFGYAATLGGPSLIEFEKSTGSPFTGFSANPFPGVEIATGGTITALNLTAVAVPEPSTWIMLVLGLIGLGYFRRKRRA